MIFKPKTLFMRTFDDKRRRLKNCSISMILTFAFILASTISSYAQSVEKQISLECNNEPLADALKKIEKASGFKVLFTYDEVQSYKVTASVNNQSIGRALQIVLRNTPLKYSVKGKFINITASHQLQQNQKNKNHRVTGKVVDENGDPLIGAAIRPVGEGLGVITDANGYFAINIPGDLSSIEISYVGMKSQIVDVQKISNIHIRMFENQHLLDEVVVTGYQTLSKERSTGSFAKVNSKTLGLKRLNDLSSMLEGEVAGYVDGQIRGISTMRAVSNPLVVIDGFPVENTILDQTGSTTEAMPDINPEDIENVTFLKDAAAASIYGARAANGVIVITTKKAKPGKINVSFSASLTVQPYKLYIKNMTDASDVVSLERLWASTNKALLAGGNSAASEAADIRENGSYPSPGVDALLNMATGAISSDEGNKILDDLASKGYQYYDQIKKYAKRNQIYQQYNMRIAKTTDRNAINFSATYWKNKYEDINHNDWKLGLNLTNSINITSWLQADIGAYLKYGEIDDQSYNMLSPGFNALPYDSVINADGSYATIRPQSIQDRRDKISMYGLIKENLIPMNELNYNLGNTKSLESRVNIRLNFNLLSWLNYNVMFQYETANDKYETLSEKESYEMTQMINNFTTKSAYGTLVYNIPNGDALFTQTQERRAYDFRQQLNLNKTIGRHNIVWILGQELRHNKYYYENDTKYGYDPDLLTWPTINETLLSNISGLLGTARKSITSAKKELLNRFVSFYSNASYTFDDKYVLSGSIRWDKSNIWGINSKYQNRPLWSVGGSWNIDKEHFFTLGFVDMLKYRLSYGIGGNISRNSAPYLVASYYSAYKVNGLAGYVKTPPNKDLRWEKTTTFNMGLDFSFFKGRLSGSLDYYNKKGDDLLAMINGSPTQGFGSSVLSTNNGAMTNRGIELTLHSEVIRNKNLSWEAILLYSYNKNTVKRVSYQPTSYTSRFTLPTSYPMADKSLYGIYAYHWAGLNEKGDPQVSDADGNATSNAVQDINAIVYAGTTMPIHSLTLTDILRFKQFEISAMLLFQGGHKIRETNIPTISMSNGRISSTSKAIMDRWQKIGDEKRTDVPRLLFSNDSENYNTHRQILYSYSDNLIYDASNIRIKNISFAYRFPMEWCRKLYMSSMKLQLNIENLATIAFDSKATYALGGKRSPNYVCSININF